MNHLLGIMGSRYYDLDKKQHDYEKIEVSEDVLNFLNQHDLCIDEKGRKIFIYNSVRYIYLGINLTIVLDDTEE